MSNKRSRYTSEFKKQAISLVREGKRSAASIAREYGINTNTLYNWLGSNGGQESKAVSDPSIEIKRLKKELAQAELERDILKKAAAYFAKETL